MLWLLVSIFAYLILAVVFLVDKYFLVGPIPSSKVYTFFIGISGILTLFLVPFVDFNTPSFPQIVLSLLAGALFVYSLFWFYKALSRFEVSRIVPAIGALVPSFTFAFVFLFSFGEETLSLLETIAFILLILGSVLVTLKKEKFINRKSLRISIITASMFSLAFVLSKYVYLELPFWTGFIWIKMGGVLVALGFLFSSKLRKELFATRMTLNHKTAGVFISNQGMGAGANILQNWAIALAPLACVAIINALQGIQYAFLLIFTTLLSLIWPLWTRKTGLKEEISGKILIQKILAILLIGAGLAFLAFK